MSTYVLKAARDLGGVIREVTLYLAYREGSQDRMLGLAFQ